MKHTMLQLVGFKQNADVSRGEFDEQFYAKHYPDLKGLRGRKALLKHFARHGKSEGRFPTLDAARERLVAQGKVLPPDFEIASYRILNPDLQRLYSEEWQYELHFLVSGSNEGRPYRFNEVAPEDRWKQIFNLYEFSVFSSAWRQDDDLTRDLAIDLFKMEGIPRLIPVAQAWSFDPLFYREFYDFAEADPVRLYRQWLFTDFPKGFVPNEIQAIWTWMGGEDYPLVFDWRAYLGVDPSHKSSFADKIAALKSLFERPLESRLARYISGDGTARLYAAIGDYHLIRGESELALDAYNRSIGHNETSRNYLRRGDALRNLGRRKLAISDYRRAASFPACSIWSVVNAAIMTMEAGDYTESFEILTAAREVWRGAPEFTQAVDRCLDLRFSQISDCIKGSLVSGEVALANAEANFNLTELTNAIRELKVREVPKLPLEGNRIVMLACMDLPQCKHYRVDQKVEQLVSLGMIVDVFDQNRPELFMSMLPGAVAAIFYRVPSFPKIIEAIIYAKSLGLPTYYDIDDLIFCADFPDSFESYEGQIPHSEYVDLQYGVPLYRHAISLCSYGLASTPPLAERLEKLVESKKAYVVENGLDSTSAFAVSIGSKPKTLANSVSIFYGSGTKAHNEDFNSIVGSALIETMKAFPQVRLVIVGYLKLDRAFDVFARRIDRYPFIGDVQKYYALIRSCDINISVLRNGPVTDCKSEIKWLEAAILQIPSVLSKTLTFEQALISGADCIIASSPDEWKQALALLINNPVRRSEIAAAARNKALYFYSIRRTSDKLRTALYAGPVLCLAAGKLVEETSGKRFRKRLLICNVFFAPQSHGGATRVVEDNVDYLIDHYSNEFDVSILATDERMPTGQLRVDEYKGCDVFRLGTPTEVNMDWRPFNEENEMPYRQILRIVRPDLVHFHCIQRLTASIVDMTIKENIPFVVTVHDAWWISDYQFLVDGNNRLVDPLDCQSRASLPKGISPLQSIERYQRLQSILREARSVAAVSGSFAAVYERCGVDNVRIIANGLSGLPAPLEMRYNERLVLAHIGGRSVHKGSALLEIALRNGRFPNVSLIMIDGTLEYGEEKHTVWGETQVCFRGQYPQKLINELFSSFDVLLAPSIWPESHGLVTREALFYGKWIVASDRGAIGDDIIDGRNGFKIDVSNTQDLSRILTIMNADPEAFKHAERGKTLLRTSAEQAEDLVRLYTAIFEKAEVPDSRAASS